MDTTDNKPTPNQLPLEPAPPAGDQAQLSSPAAAEKAAAEKAAAEKAAAEKAAGRPGSRAATKARVTKPKPPTGRRPRKKADAEPAAPEPERVAVVLKTSRYTGRNGRAVARKSTVLVTIDRGLQLIMLDHAREATEEETAAARGLGKPIFLD